MLFKHPIISVTGRQGWNELREKTFEQIFRREGIRRLLSKATHSTVTTELEWRL